MVDMRLSHLQDRASETICSSYIGRNIVRLRVCHNKGVLAVTKGSSNMKNLSLQSINVTDEALTVVGVFSLALESLALYSFQRFTDMPVVLLNLHILKLMAATILTHTGLKESEDLASSLFMRTKKKKNIDKAVTAVTYTPTSIVSTASVVTPAVVEPIKVKDKQEKDKIRIKPDKNGKRGKAGNMMMVDSNLQTQTQFKHLFPVIRRFSPDDPFFASGNIERELLAKQDSLRSILLAEKLTGSNFTNWYRNLRNVLRYEKKMKFVEQPIGPAPDPKTADPDTIDKYYESVNLEQEVACLMLSSMSPALQRTLEKYNAYDMLKELKTMFEEQAKQEVSETVKAFHACKQEDDQSVSSYLLKMKSYLDTFERPGYAMPKDLGVSLILNSLNKDYDQFVQNYNMHSKGKTLAELHAMLKLHEKGILKKTETPVVLAIHEGKIQKDRKKPQRAKDNVFYFNAIPHDDIYEIDMHNLYSNVSSIYNVSNKRAKHRLDSYYIWHCRLGHINKKHMDLLQRNGLLQPTHDESHEKCKSYISGKMARKPFPHQVERAKDLLGLIHTNVYGPFRTVSREGANYFITFTNYFSRYGFVYLMKHKHEVFETFKVFQNEVKNQLGKKTKAIRSDRGREYTSHEFVNLMKSCGIVSPLTPPYTPQHNRVSKRRNRTLLDTVRSMMNLTTLLKSFWGYALDTADRILNMVQTKKVDRKPYEIWHKKAPNLSYLRVWGCYPKETMGYYFYYPLKNKIFVSQNTEFFKNSFMVQEASWSHRLLELSESDKGLEIIQEEDTQPSENTSKEHNEVATIEEYELGDLDEPPNYKAALADPESDKWLKTMNTEMQSMKDNQVWYLVDLPSNGRIVRCKWLFKKKTDMDGNVHTFKARLVAKGYTQTCGVDYGETFSPVVDIRAIRILLAIAAFYDYEVWQIDVKTAFLNSHLSEDVYMVQPEGFVDPKHPTKVCKLQRFIYGLKQASRSWNKRLRRSSIYPWNQDIRDRSKWLIALSQSAYLQKIIKKFRMQNSKKGYIPMMEKPDYRKSQGAKIPTEQNPSKIQWTAVKTILKYLRNTKDMVLVYGEKPEDELKVSHYVDVSFQTDRDDTKSQMGYVFVLNGGAADWKSAKQSTTAMSSIEAEYIATVEASMEAVWMRKFIHELGGVMPSNERPMEMKCAKEPALAIEGIDLRTNVIKAHDLLY
nr:retrotransposon protein, putative, Ty1-copia subclass [Tanacetum cinerariifolium]